MATIPVSQGAGLSYNIIYVDTTKITCLKHFNRLVFIQKFLNGGILYDALSSVIESLKSTNYASRILIYVPS